MRFIKLLFLSSFCFLVKEASAQKMGEGGKASAAMREAIEAKSSGKAPIPKSRSGAPAVEWKASAPAEKISPSSRTPAPKDRGGSGCMSISDFDFLVDYNAQRGGVYGMTIRPRFTINNAQGQQIQIAVYFYDAAGNKLSDNNNLYTTADGQVATSVVVQPGYQTTHYNYSQNDFVIFFPRDEISTAPGKTKFFYKLEVYDQPGSVANLIYKSEYYTLYITN
jgi:hypothetical protein